jgi:hypothetical protein
MRAAMETMMTTGLAEGELIDFMGQIEAKLEAKAEAKLEAKVEAKAKAESLLIVLHARGLPVSDAVRSKITACHDATTLARWTVRAVTARTADEVVDDASPV